MEFLFPTVGLILAGALALVARKAYTRQRRLLAGWHTAAGELGLQVVRSDTYGRHKIAGELEGVAVEVHAVRRSGARRRPITHFSARSRGIPADLSIRWQGLLGELRDAAGGRQRLRTGNESFDEQTWVSGAEAPTTALLDRATRAALTGVLAPRNGKVEGGTVAFELPGLIAEPERIVAAVRDLDDLTRRLSLTGRSVPELLHASATTDPIGPVRRRSLEVLIRHYPQEPETTRACEWTVTEGGDPEVTLVAAGHLRQRGWPYLEELVKSPAVEDALRIAALEHLIAHVPGGRLVPFLEAVVGQRYRPLHPPALRALGRLRPPGAFESAVGRLNGADEATAVAAAQVLGDLGDPRAEPALLGLMGRTEATVRAAAATALGKVGTRRAIELLLACSESSPLLFEGEVRRALQEALDLIRARLDEGADMGQLSLAAGTGDLGSLSVVVGEGALSPATPRDQEAEAPQGTTGSEAAPGPAAEPPRSDS
ncbi:MAG: HEAT repeat domain-containing protein [Planctomycetes bacterium]|nr:HEAT repeat domain-containing protein [Planctomycetota bacterium]